MVTKYTVVAIIIIVIIAGAAIAHTYSISAQTVRLHSAGASFPYPLIDEMIDNYNRIVPYVEVNYQPSGSGAGITALIDKTVDFAGSDAPLSASEREKAPNVLHIPITIGAIALAYNLPNINSGLNLTGQAIADIYEGKITMWNDPTIADLNPTITLPAEKITTVHRSESSGTTFVFTGYLSAMSPSWESNIGQSKSVSWPSANDVASSGNTGVAQIVNSTQYSIGYVELAYTLQTGMTVAAVRNSFGNYVLPTLESTGVAAQFVGSGGLPGGDADWGEVNIIDVDAVDAYSIVSFSYILVYRELGVVSGMTMDRADAIVQFLWYMVRDGQKIANKLEYASLPNNVITLNEATIKLITFNGQIVLTH